LFQSLFYFLFLLLFDKKGNKKTFGRGQVSYYICITKYSLKVIGFNETPQKEFLNGTKQK
jgi:hypothetical protein